MVPDLMMSSKGRTELQVYLEQKMSRKLLVTSVFAYFLKKKQFFRQMFSKFSESVRTHLNASKRIQTHPNASEHIRTYPNMSEQVRANPKTSKNLQKR